jgi:hypothetical protein
MREMLSTGSCSQSRGCDRPDRPGALADFQARDEKRRDETGPAAEIDVCNSVTRICSAASSVQRHRANAPHCRAQPSTSTQGRVPAAFAFELLYGCLHLPSRFPSLLPPPCGELPDQENNHPHKSLNKLATLQPHNLQPPTASLSSISATPSHFDCSCAGQRSSYRDLLAASPPLRHARPEEGPVGDQIRAQRAVRLALLAGFGALHSEAWSRQGECATNPPSQAVATPLVPGYGRSLIMTLPDERVHLLAVMSRVSALAVSPRLCQSPSDAELP